jgi:Glycosyl transferase family 2
MTSGSRSDRQRVAACLIVQNEQERLGAALDSVAFCDEVIVVDGGSTDQTVAMARRAGATVIENAWPGFAAQRNVALDAATSEWILEIDADERVSPTLRASIEAFLAEPPAGVEMAVCAWRNHFLGKSLGPSAKYPAYRSRLFRREAYRHDESRRVHEGVEARERPGVLEGDLEHELAGTLGEALLDTWRYAQLESQHVQARQPAGAYLVGMVLRPAAKLGYRTTIEGGWRDGGRGLLKILLDATSDALVWALALARSRRNPTEAHEPPPETASTLHFGRRPVGRAKVVAVADAGSAARAARSWLTELQSRGLDVALIATESSASGTSGDGTNGQLHVFGAMREIPVRVVARLRPLAVIRALEIETQLRTTDAVVWVGRRSRLIGRVVPRTLRRETPGLDIDLAPEQAVELANSVTRR